MKLSVPALFAAFVISSLANSLPTASAAQQQGATCGLLMESEFYTDGCPPLDPCSSLSFPFVVIKRSNCGGCCVHGTATVTCFMGATSSQTLDICAACGQNGGGFLTCPNNPNGIAWRIFITCKPCP